MPKKGFLHAIILEILSIQKTFSTEENLFLEIFKIRSSGFFVNWNKKKLEAIQIVSLNSETINILLIEAETSV